MKARFICIACAAILLSMTSTALCLRATFPIGNVTREQVIDKYLRDRALEPAEGIWTTDDGTYEVAIIKNTSSEFPGYDYLGIVTGSQVSKFKLGLIKLLMKKTAVESVSPGVWFMRDFTDQGSTFTLSSDHDSLECAWAGYTDKFRLLRVYPKAATTDPSDAEGRSGTGFFVSPQLLVTNCHVVGEAASVRFLLQDGSSHPATVVARDFANDLALVKASDWTSQAYIRLASPRDVVQGARVYTIGYPLSQEMGGRAKVGEGLVNGVTGLGDDPRMFQISIPVQPGNSGGPLLDTQARVVGVVTSTLNSVYLIRKAGVIPQNVNFAVKINYVDNLLAVARERIPEGVLPPTELDAAGVAQRVQDAVVHIVSTAAGS